LEFLCNGTERTLESRDDVVIKSDFSRVLGRDKHRRCLAGMPPFLQDKVRYDIHGVCSHILGIPTT